MAHIFARIGWPVAQLQGGYQSFRRHVHAELPQLATQVSWKVICGPTGSGKSALLETLAAQGAPVLDLEQLASHRGSLLGALPGTVQPSQKQFESQIWLRLKQAAGQTLYVESESKKVGNLRVPDCVMEAIRAAECVCWKRRLMNGCAFCVTAIRTGCSSRMYYASAYRIWQYNTGISRYRYGRRWYSRQPSAN
jgi:tRNA 2-selenouridine synthase